MHLDEENEVLEYDERETLLVNLKNVAGTMYTGMPRPFVMRSASDRQYRSCECHSELAHANASFPSLTDSADCLLWHDLLPCDAMQSGCCTPSSS